MDGTMCLGCTVCENNPFQLKKKRKNKSLDFYPCPPFNIILLLSFNYYKRTSFGMFKTTYHFLLLLQAEFKP